MPSLVSCNTNTHSLSLSPFLPDELKGKYSTFERQIYELHQQLRGTSETDGKYHFVTKVRSLPTFGANFFLVREPQKGRKMVPLLLGIKNDSILRVNAESKEIMETFPLSNVKRWAKTEKIFSVDLGDKTLSVETADGKKLSELLDLYVKNLQESKKNM